MLPWPAASASCDTIDGIESICSLVAPEDVVRSPSPQHLLFGQMAAPGGLFALDTRNDAVLNLTSPGALQVETQAGWGDPACVEPPSEWLLHGLDSTARPDGRWQLLAVNHGGRESVEFFEIESTQAGDLRAIWRGCVEPPGDSSLNDVAALPDGGFVVSQPTSASAGMGTLLLALMGIDSGFVYRWRPDLGFSEQPGTQGRFPNGVTVSPDGSTLYMNEYIAGRLRVIDIASGEQLGEVEIDKPDNSNWSQNGMLLVASHKAGILEVAGSLEQSNEEPSLLPFAIVEVNPKTLKTRELVARDGPPMGAGTAAIDVGSLLYVGSYVGDRIIKIPFSR
ncbi:MAG: SMP-30/gluconolactonase/LRE family protein [Halioglobus sp.]